MIHRCDSRLFGIVTVLALSTCTVLFGFKGDDVDQAQLQPYRISRGKITSIAISPDGTLLAIGQYESRIRVWNLKLKKSQTTISIAGVSARAVTFSSSRTILTGDKDFSFSSYSVKNNDVIHQFNAHTKDVTALGWNSKRNIIASGDADNKIKLWSDRDKKIIHSLVPVFKTRKTGWVSSLALSPSGNMSVSSHMGQKGTSSPPVRVWDTANGKEVTGFGRSHGWVYGVAFSFDGALLATAGEDKTVRVWNVKTWNVENKLEGHAGEVACVAFHPKEHVIVSGSGDCTVRIWDVKKGKEVGRFTKHKARVVSIAVDPAGKFVASADEKGTVWVWQWPEKSSNKK